MKTPGFNAANSDGYCRVLTDRQADEGESLDVQRRLVDLEEGLDNYCRASPTSPFPDAVDAFIRAAVSDN